MHHPYASNVGNQSDNDTPANQAVAQAVEAKRKTRARRKGVAQTRRDLYVHNKKQTEIDLDEIFALLERAQELNHKASTHQDVLQSGFPTATEPIVVCMISDWHLASHGTDHRYAKRFLQEIESIPDLYLVIVGVEPGEHA